MDVLCRKTQVALLISSYGLYKNPRVCVCVHVYECVSMCTNVFVCVQMHMYADMHMCMRVELREHCGGYAQTCHLPSLRQGVSLA